MLHLSISFEVAFDENKVTLYKQIENPIMRLDDHIMLSLPFHLPALTITTSVSLFAYASILNLETQ